MVWQSSKISATESCLYDIINIRVTPFLDGGIWFLTTLYTISSEELFVLLQQKMPYLCGLWRFANAYMLSKSMRRYYEKEIQNFANYCKSI